jgi:hypothetical protein
MSISTVSTSNFIGAKCKNVNFGKTCVGAGVEHAPNTKNDATTTAVKIVYFFTKHLFQTKPRAES